MNPYETVITAIVGAFVLGAATTIIPAVGVIGGVLQMLGLVAFVLIVIVMIGQFTGKPLMNIDPRLYLIALLIIAAENAFMVSLLGLAVVVLGAPIGQVGVNLFLSLLVGGLFGFIALREAKQLPSWS